MTFRFLLLLSMTLAAVSSSAAPLRVLYFTKSSGFEHSVVKRTDGQPAFSERVLAALGEKHGFTVTCSKDGSLFSPAYLAAFDVIVFYTSGDLCAVGPDGAPAMTAEGKQALLDAIAGGKGFVGVHSACDTFHTGETGPGYPKDQSGRYREHGMAADPYIRLLGGEFISHGPQQVARVRVTSRAFPGCAGLGESFSCHEEWYSLKEFAEDLHVLLVLETAGMQGRDYARPDLPLAWARRHGQGRVWFTAMGHREDVWESERFQAMLAGGIAWAGRRVEAEVSPNLRAVAPGARTLQAPPVVAAP